MKNLMAQEIDRYRVRSREVVAFYGSAGDDSHGVFRIPSKSNGRELTVIASVGDGWEHVSVSRPNRPPTWAEMEQIKRLFFRDEEVVMQLHVPAADHISFHDNCLHLWRPIGEAIPRPPGWMVAPKSARRVPA